MANRIHVKLHDICESDYIITPQLISCGVDRVGKTLHLNGAVYTYSNEEYLINDRNKIRTEMLDSKNWNDYKPQVNVTRSLNEKGSTGNS